MTGPTAPGAGSSIPPGDESRVPPGAPPAGRFRVLRAAAYALLPGEIVLVVCLVAGVTVPGPVLVGAEIAVLLLLVAEAATYVRLRRRGLSRREVFAELVPEPVRRLVGHELRLMASLGLWVARRRHGVRAGGRAFPHARDQAALMYGFAFVCLVETVGMSYLLADLPAVHAVVLVLDVYTVLFVLGLHAASVTRPHVLTSGALRLRQAAHIDLTIPLGTIAAVRHELRFTHEKADGELNLAVGSQTSLSIELTESVDVPRLLGGTRPIHTVRCHADDARALVQALRPALTQALTQALTRERTAPSPAQDPPASA
ncbi:hypothetical protein [Streptomyces sp. NPDC093600]|uniref:hypothetical protein n=1 Tax=Streptomyces sp. NPDC093600 TaxID=3366047 RepID=UPI0037F4AE7D